MIDAHTLFAPGWDNLILEEMARLPKRSILSCYPRNFSYPVAHVKPTWTYANRPVYMESNGLDPNGMFLFKYVLHSHPFDEPVLSKGLGACMLVLPVSVIYEAPYLNNVPFLFIGEETCMWAKYFEAGYDVYNPTKDIVQTTFVRKHRANFHREARSSQAKRAKQSESLDKVKRFLRMTTGDPNSSFEVENRPRISVRNRETFVGFLRDLSRRKGPQKAAEFFSAFPQYRAQ